MWKSSYTTDKSSNIYKIERADYRKLLHDNIRWTYKNSDLRKINNIIKDEKKIALVLGLEDRIEKMQESESYITVKDHKEDFVMLSNKHIQVGHW